MTIFEWVLEGSIACETDAWVTRADVRATPQEYVVIASDQRERGNLVVRSSTGEMATPVPGQAVGFASSP